MKKLILVLALTIASASACVTPVKPVAPIGCSSSDAVLITNADGTCSWVFMGC